MKKFSTSAFLVSLLLVFCNLSIAFGQNGECQLANACTFVNGSQYPSATQTTSSTSFVAVAPDSWPGEFSVYNVTNGVTYEWSLCPSDGSVAVTYDPQLTLFNGTTNGLLCYSDDLCGTSPKIRWTANFSGTVKLQLNQFNCLSGLQENTQIMWRTVSTISNDTEVAAIYTLGTTSTLASNPQIVRALVRNVGTSNINNKVVTLTVSGANTFSTSFTVSSLAVGASTIVSFSGFSSTNTGINNISVSVPTDGNNTNNSKSTSQTVSTNSINFEVGTIPEDGIGFNNIVGELASKFSVSGTQSIDQISLRFDEGGASYQVKLFSVSAINGQPSVELFTSATLTAPLGLVQIPVSPAVSVSGGFYVVVRQTTTTPFLSLGAQIESPVRAETFYFRSGTTTAWTDFSTQNFDFKLMTGVRFVSGNLSDVEVTTLYTLGSIASPASSPHVVRALITNVGNVPVTNKTVSLSISGANTFNTSVNIASLAANASTLVSFNGFTPTSTGANTVTVSVPNDGNNSNNSQSSSQSVTSNTISYAEGTIPDDGIGFNNATGEVASKFTVTGTQSISEIFARFTDAGANYQVKLYSATGANGEPGTELFTTSTLTATAGQVSIPVSPAVSVSGSFYVVISQTTTAGRLELAYEAEVPIRSQSFYFRSGAVTTWTDFSTQGSSNFRVMCGVRLATALNDAEVTTLYSLGSLSTLGSNPHVIRALVSNTGTTTLTNKLVTLSITGSNTFNTSVTIPSLASGQSTTVVFPGFSSTNTGTNNISVSVPSDGNNTNNSRSLSQLVTSNLISYEVGSTESSSVGFNNTTGEIATKFTVSGIQQIDQISVRFGSAGASYQVKLFDASGSNGEPGIEVFSSNVRTATAGLVQIPVSPSAAFSGSFYVVVSQLSNTFLALSYQDEVPIRNQTFYSRPIAGTWSDFSANNADWRLMVGVRLGTCVAPVQPGIISGAGAPCSGSSVTYSVLPVQDATSYTWTLPNGWTGTSTTNSITTVVGTTGGNISVTANGACGSSNPRTLSVTVNAILVLQGPITGSGQVCVGSNATYSVLPVAGATSYVWTLPAGWGGASSTNSINASIGTAGGNVTVAAVGVCGASAVLSLPVSVNSLPPAPGAISGSNSVCGGSTQLYSVNPVSGATGYLWVLPSGWSGSSTSNAISATAGSASGIVEVKSVNGCGQSNATSLVVTVNPPGNATFSYSLPAYCLGGTNPVPTISATGVFSASPAGLNFVNVATGEINLQTSLPNTYTVTFTTTGNCPASTNTSIIIRSSVSAAFAYQSPAFCKNSTTVPVPVLAPGASIGTFSSVPVGLSVNATNGQIVLSQSQAGTYTVTNTIAPLGGCPGASSNVFVTINNAPTAVVSGGGNICSNGNQTVPVTITFTGTPPYSFTYTANGIPTNVNGHSASTFVINASASANYEVTSVQDAVCQSIGTGVANVVINATPVVSLTPFVNTCSNAPSIVLTGGIPQGGVYSGTGVSAGVFNPSQATGTVNVTYTFTTPNTTCSASATQPITVLVAPEATLTPFANALCLNRGTITLTNGSPAGGVYSGPGVSNGVLDPTIPGLGSHTLKYIFANSNGCSDTASVSFSIEFCTSVMQESRQANLLVWPNPAQNELHVGLDQFGLSEIQMSLVAPDGKIFNLDNLETRKGTEAIIQVGQFQKGIYQLMVKQEDTIFRKAISIL